MEARAATGIATAATTSPYHDMITTLIRLVEPYHIDIYHCHFFSEMILEIGGIKEAHQGCQFAESMRVRGMIVNFDFVISTESGTQLVANLNTQFPELKAEDGTAEYEQRSNEKNSVDGKPARFIRMDALAVKTHLLPRIAELLQTNPRRALEQVHRYSFNHVCDKINKELAQFGIDTSHDCFEETVCMTVNRHFFPVMTSRFFSEKQTLPSQEQKEGEMVITTSSRFRPNETNPFKTDILITANLAKAKKVENFFNSLKSDCAVLAPDNVFLKDKNLLLSMITVDNQILLTEKFWIPFRDTIIKYPRETIERYREESGTIHQTTLKCTVALKETADSLNSVIQGITLELTKNRAVNLQKALVTLYAYLVSVDYQNVPFIPLVSAGCSPLSSTLLKRIAEVKAAKKAMDDYLDASHDLRRACLAHPAEVEEMLRDQNKSLQVSLDANQQTVDLLMPLLRKIKELADDLHDLASNEIRPSHRIRREEYHAPLFGSHPDYNPIQIIARC